MGVAPERAGELAGEPTLGVGHHMVDVALVGGDVAAGRVLAVLVANLDGTPDGTLEAALPADGEQGGVVGEQHGFEHRRVEIRTKVAR